MLSEYVSGVITRELRALKRELSAYPLEATIWETPDGIENSAGTLALHLAGNLQHFIGGQLSDTGYVRDRSAEFQRRDVPREELLSEIDQAIRSVEATLSGLAEERSEDLYPLDLRGVRVTIGDFLLHLATHAAYHVGQVNYHRRILTGKNHTVGALAIPELSSARPAPC